MGKASLRHAAKWTVIAGSMSLASACASVDAGDAPADTGAPNAPTERCAADAYQHLVGQRIGELHTDSLPVPLRIYSTTDMVTMDFRVDRMNIIHTPQGEVIEVKCG